MFITIILPEPTPFYNFITKKDVTVNLPLFYPPTLPLPSLPK